VNREPQECSKACENKYSALKPSAPNASHHGQQQQKQQQQEKGNPIS
jgi:hypothetical protein